VAIKFELPHKAVLSERPFGEDGCAGKAGVIAKEGVSAWLERTGVETFVSGGVYAGNDGGGLCGKWALPQTSVVRSTLISVIVQNLNEIRQSPEEL